MQCISKYFISLLVAVLLSGCSQYKVYSVKDSPKIPVSGGVIYALPKTQVKVAVTVERRDLSKAIYSNYATDYLGIDASELDTNYHIVAIDVSSVNVADPDYYYYVKVRSGSVTVDRRHLLLAIGCQNPESNVAAGMADEDVNVDNQKRDVKAEYNLYDRADTFYTRYDTPGRPTKVSSKKDVRSVKQRAAAAAERLEEIQDKEQQLLNGEYEGSYGAEAVQYLFGQLKKQEQAIIDDFCGYAKRETVCFYVDPVMRKKDDFVDTVIWFSEKEGFVGDAEHLPSDAFPIVCDIHCDNDLRMTNRFVKYHTSGFTSQSSAGRTGTAATKTRNRRNFRYRVPEQATVTVTTPAFSVSRQLLVSQLGPVVELPRHRIKALFDANTLDLKQMERSRMF